MSTKQSTVTHWSDYWDNPPSVELSRQFNPVLVEWVATHLPTLQDKWILEAGCGTALDTLELARRGAKAIAYDYSSAALQFAKQMAVRDETKLSAIQGDILRFPFPSETFDVVFHTGVLEHFHDPKAVMLEQKRILKRGGLLLIDVPQTYNLYTVYKSIQIARGKWFAGWETQFTIHQLRTLFESTGFEVVGQYGRGYYPPFLGKLRWATSIGKGFIGRPFMPRHVARLYEKFWSNVESSPNFVHFSHNIGVLGRLP